MTAKSGAVIMRESVQTRQDSSQESTQDGINSVLKKARKPGRGKGNYQLSNLALVAGTFDYLGFESLINDLVGKTGSHVSADTGALVKLLCMQMLNAPRQALWNTDLFMEEIPCEALLGTGITPDDVNRTVLARMLDDVHSFGTEKLFVTLARQVFTKLGLEPHEVHIDSTSFHYHGQSRKEDGCEIILKKGYSRDLHPELNQAISLMLVDGASRIPLWGRNISGNINDNTSFLDMVSNSLPKLIKEQFASLKYLVGDSALCTDPILKAAAEQKIPVITRLPDKLDLAKDCYALLDKEEYRQKLERVYAQKPDGEEDENFGLWCGVQDYNGTRLKLLLIQNRAMRSRKEKTVSKRADKELEKLKAALKKLRTQPCKCRPDAEKAVEALQKKLRFCRIDVIDYKPLTKNAKPGKPKKGAEKVLTGVAVIAKASVDSQKLQTAVDGELLYVVATTDTERKWTMAELLSTYKRQSVIERCWRCCKNPTMMVDSMYLQKPSRIDALLWLMEIALLVYAATEYMVRKVMKEKKLKLTGQERRKYIRPTGEFLLKYVSFLNIALVLNRSTGEWTVENVNEEFALLLTALGHEWLNEVETPAQ
jgi:transposase